MATFSFKSVEKAKSDKKPFKLSTISKKVGKHIVTKGNHSNVIKSGLSLVVDTTEEGLFFVVYENKNYEISLDSYNCAKSNEVYITTLHKGKIIRYSSPSRRIGNAKNYIRFIPGNTVKGYIFKNEKTSKEEFYVEEVIFDFPNKLEQLRKFYANFKQIVDYLDVKLKVIRQSQFI